jgi:hypothetical protein
VLKRWDKSIAGIIGLDMEAAALEHNGGHNGIHIAEDGHSMFGGERCIEVGSNWNIDWVEDT